MAKPLVVGHIKCHFFVTVCLQSNAKLVVRIQVSVRFIVQLQQHIVVISMSERDKHTEN